jgi:hypothetical protein
MVQKLHQFCCGVKFITCDNVFKATTHVGDEEKNFNFFVAIVIDAMMSGIAPIEIL